MLQSSLIGKACAAGLIEYHVVNPRAFSQDKHLRVDDTPFGGGEGMVIRADVLHRAWESVVGEGARKGTNPGVRTIFLSPQGAPLQQSRVRELAQYEHLVLVCGHYEAIDERFIEECVDEEISLGDYILTGGELPALVLADAVGRWVPGVLGNERSLTEESFEGGLLKYPQYTKPREWQGLGIPEVLLSGDHAKIDKWRQSQRLDRTQKRRPDLYQRYLAEKSKN